MLLSKCILTLPTSQGSASRETCPPLLFHLVQFLFNFFKYSFLNFPLFYPSKIFTIYFPSNSLLINTSASRFNSLSFSFSFLFSTHLISFFLISCSNFSTNFIAFPKFSNSSYIFSSAVYPFHLTKYFSFPLTSHLLNIFSISYSFSLYLY